MTNDNVVNLNELFTKVKEEKELRELIEEINDMDFKGNKLMISKREEINELMKAEHPLINLREIMDIIKEMLFTTETVNNYKNLFHKE